MFCCITNDNCKNFHLVEELIFRLSIVRFGFLVKFERLNLLQSAVIHSLSKGPLCENLKNYASVARKMHTSNCGLMLDLSTNTCRTFNILKTFQIFEADSNFSSSEGDFWCRRALYCAYD